jgi:hypothetical protein
MNSNWKTSVTELIVIFRGALLSLIPWLEKAKIKWSEEESYDDWDSIVEALYLNIVCSTLIGEISSEYKIAKYNFYYDSYKSLNFIRALDKNNPEKTFVFIDFKSSIHPLDKVKVAELDKLDKIVGYTYLKFEDIDFVYVKNINGKKEFIESIEVEF